MLNNYLLIVNAITCAVISARMILYRRNGATHRPIAAFFAWLLIVASASVTIRILTGDYHYANWSETLINVGFCVAVMSSRGNVMTLAKPMQRFTHDKGRHL
ncbi:phage holin family protein [Serratia rhizosphaerae]|uniref:Phage holin family protein n=1 Tax=Serratia rhizosphaerae TaxID=2597702 RepID=A0ABX6GH42_9GAMM|nr:phage holin family protein [Serratia rhizosphaerae]QHA85554.1 phage holin family protein [Serratia rhizosphaerae]